MEEGEARWHWLGGRPALDFVNTRRERWRRDVETLEAPADLAEWLVAAGLLPEAMPVPRAVLREARDLREAIDQAVIAVLAGAEPDTAVLTRIDDWLVHAGTRPQLRPGVDGAPELGERPAADSPRRALGTIALDAARMLGIPAERARIRVCGAEDCSARFYDRSPAAARRWCSMSTCGNVAKARRHRSRRREGETAERGLAGQAESAPKPALSGKMAPS
jgi:predicted RNA-binding Zn ribbon-like protein